MSDPFTLRPVGNPLDGLFHLEGPRVAVSTLYGFVQSERDRIFAVIDAAEAYAQISKVDTGGTSARECFDDLDRALCDLRGVPYERFDG